MNEDDFKKLVLMSDTFENAVLNTEAYSFDEKYNKALCTCFAKVYENNRSSGSEYKTFLGYVVAKTQLRKVCTQQEKLLAVRALLAFLAGDKKLIDVCELESDYPALFEPGSELGLLTEQIKKVNDPAFFQKQPVSRGYFSNIFY